MKESIEKVKKEVNPKIIPRKMQDELFPKNLSDVIKNTNPQISPRAMQDKLFPKGEHMLFSLPNPSSQPKADFLIRHGEHKSGTISQITWDNPTLKQALQRVFNVRSGEKIVEITFNENYLTARFEYDVS